MEIEAMVKTVSRKSMVLALGAAGALWASQPALAEGFFFESDAPAAAGAAMVMPAITVDIPTINADGSSLDEAVLREILSGNLSVHAQDLATLNAKSILVPKINIRFEVKNGVKAEQVEAVISDVALNDVVNGVAASVVLGGIDVSSNIDAFKMHFAKMAGHQFDIGGLLGFYGLVPGSADQPLKTVYKDVSYEGGSFGDTNFSCNFAGGESGEYRARPLKVSYAELMSISKLTTTGEPSVEMIAKMVSFYADLFAAIESSPTSMGRIDCTGTGDDGKPFNASIGSVLIEGMANARYPGITINDIKINAADGTMHLGKLEMRGFDIGAPLAVLDAQQGQLDEAWFAANYRKVIPAFEGFSFSGFDMDLPDTEVPGKRIVAQIDAFDLILSGYKNGIPTHIDTSASGVSVPLPADSTDDSVKQLLAAGVTQIKGGYEIAAAWDAATKTIHIDKIALNGDKLGALAFAANLGNAAEEIFSEDNNVALTALIGMTVKDVKIDLTDAGLLQIALANAAAEQKTDAATLQGSASGMAEGAILAVLGSTDEARKLGQAVGDFVSGKMKGLTIAVTAKDPAGLAVPALMAASQDPTVLAGQVSIDGSSH